MISPLDTYIGWDRPMHNKLCKRPEWDISWRTEERKDRYHYRGDDPLKHKCAQEDCTHLNYYDEKVVRVVCKSCGAAHIITGEQTSDTGESTTSTKYLGYGLQPRQVSGLLLWPGHPYLEFGRLGTTEPHDFVLTRTKVKEVTEATVVGQITQSRGERGGIVWTALAVPDPGGQFGYGQKIRWAHANDGRGRGGTPLRSVGSATRWIGERLTEAQGNAA
ncbi:hypothetical protein ACIBAC_29100 [Streptomyces sp. NPDC051362]|uniref:hypothetical protein n=1 Tax=Streptomyces sp. NPDC051362 TaxID=3365651 RepID=UPI0037B43508